MFNNLLCVEKMSFVDKLSEAGTVVLIGIVLVFIILAFLIGIVQTLRYFDRIMNKWDGMMLIYRSNKAKYKAIKTEYIDNRDILINEVYALLTSKEIDESDAKKRIANIKADYIALKPEINAKIADAKAENKKAKNAIAVIDSTSSVASNEEACQNVSDDKIIAVITAAIAVATEQECAIRKVKFKVRSIKEVK